MKENINPTEEKVKIAKDTIDAVTGLVKAVPIYEDAVQPAAKQLGKSLETITKVVNLALAPVSGLVWGYEKICEFVTDTVPEKLVNVAQEKIITPDAAVVGPALESLRFLGNNETLREMYANLIANSMDADTAKNAHPGFVEIIKNMSADEGLLLKAFIPNVYQPIMDVKLKSKTGTQGEHNLLENYCAIGQIAGCKHIDLVPNYIDNLCRLGLLHIPPGRNLVGEGVYDILTEDDEYKKVKLKYETEHTTTTEIKKYIELTGLGAQFRSACILNKNPNS